MIVDTNGDPLHNLWSTTIFGQQAIQYPADLWLYERVLHDMALAGHPVRCIIELGSGSGGLSMYLALQAKAHGAQFWTLDHFVTPAAATPLGAFLGLADRCITGDMWAASLQDRLAALFADPANHPLLLLCDGGNKPREFQTCVPQLQAGDIVCVHDFHNEFDLPDIPAPLAARVTLLHGDLADQLALLTRAWRVTA